MTVSNEEYQKLASKSYGQHDKGAEVIDGWIVMDYVKKDNGFQAMTVKNKNTNEIVVAFAGTNDLQDIASDTLIATSNQTVQFMETRKFLIDQAAQNNQTLDEFIRGNNVTFTGHSLGGGNAQYATYITSEYGSSAVTFNAVGIGQSIGLNEEDAANFNVKDFVNVFDNIGEFGVQLGTTEYVNTFKGNVVRDLANYLIETMGGHSLDQFAGIFDDEGKVYDTFSSDNSFVSLMADALFNLLAGINDVLNLDDIARAFEQAASAQRVDPFALDLDGDGVETTSIENGVYFDIDNSGFKEKTSWLHSDDGFLVLDKNSNGFIDNGGELFGDQMTMKNGNLAKSSIEALADYDDNADKIIDANDSIYSTLKVWRDSNGDGVSDSEELFTLDELGIQSINLTSSAVGTPDGKGNIIRSSSTYTKADGTVGSAYELLLDRDTVDRQNVEMEIREEIKALPEINGSGNLLSLRQSMNQNAGLETLVSEFSAHESVSNREALVDQIIYKWTGTEAVQTNSRGSYIDGRKLAALEKFMGRSYSGVDGSNPNNNAGPILENTYFQLRESIYVQLISQTLLKDSIGEVLETITYSDFYNQSPTSGESTGKLIELFDGYLNETAGSEKISETIRSLKGFGLGSYINIGEIRDYYLEYDAELAFRIDAAGRLTSVGTTSDQTIVTNDQENAIDGKSGNDTLDGRGGNDFIYGGAGNDTLIGGSGDDFLYGGADNDTLSGDSGNDVLIGGKGNDVLKGGTGNDEYRYTVGDGNKTMIESGSKSEVDKIVITGAINKEDLQFGREGYDLVITMNTTEDILVVVDYFKELGASIEKIELSNGEIIQHADIRDYLLRGTDQNDRLHGESTNDVLNGLAGSDHLMAYSGNDLLNGGEGDDLLEGGLGSDTYLFNSGFGDDVVIDQDTVGTQDKIVFGEGIVKENIQLNRMEYDLILTHGTDSVTVKNFFLRNSGYLVETIEFHDGATWDYDYIKEAVIHITEGNDVIYGYESSDVLDGLAGDDTIFGDIGNDQLIGGAGNDHLYGDAGSDILIGGIGDDVLHGGTGDNIFRFEKGDGRDVLNLSIPPIQYDFGYVANQDWDGRSWSDGGRDAFDGFGSTSITVNGQTASNISFGQADGVARTISVGGQTFETTALYLNSNLLELSITSLGTAPFQLNTKGNLGSDGNEVYSEGFLSVQGKQVKYAYSKDRGGDPGVFFFVIADEGDVSGLYSRNGDNISGTVNHVDRKVKIYIATGYKTQEEMAQMIEGHLFSSNVVQLGEGITENEVTISRNGFDLVIHTGNETDAITIQDWYKGNKLDRLEFSDGTIWSTEKLHELGLNLTLEAEGELIGLDNENDQLHGSQGNDTILGYSGNDHLYGDVGDDVLQGGIGNDLLEGGNGNDTLFGDAGNDFLSGGAGDDELHGGTGHNTYFFSLGDGTDTLHVTTGSQNSNIVKLGEGISEDLVSVTRNGLDLVIRFGDEESLTVSDWYNGNQLDQIEFVDGTVWSRDMLHEKGLTVTLVEAGTIDGLINEDDTLTGSQFDDGIHGLSGNDQIAGGAGNDALYGDSGDDVLTGGLGDDVLDGGSGNNIFRFGRGDGHDTIHLSAPQIQFDFGYTATKDWDGRSWSDGGRDAFDGFGNTSITVNGQTASNITFGPADGVTRTIVVGGQVFETTAAYLHNNLLELSVVSKGSLPFQLTTNGNLGSDGNEVYSEGILSVHGKQVKYAYSKDRGGDPGVFFFMLPDGTQTSGSYTRSGDSISGTLTNVDTSAKIYIATGYKTKEEFASLLEKQLFTTDVLQLVEGVNPEDVTVTRNGFDLIIRIDEKDSVTVSDWYNGSQFDRLEFADGTVWTPEVLHEMGLTVTMTETGSFDGLEYENDILFGSQFDDVIRGLTGNDQLSGGAGNDVLYGGSGDDIVTGGLGDDVLYGGAGNDVFHFNRGDGHDTLNIASPVFDYGYTSTQDWDGRSWTDGGRDAFDGFGYTSITVNGQTSQNIPFGNADGKTRTLTVGGQTFETTAAYLHSNLLELTVVSQGGLPFQLTTSGGLGSDGNEVYTEGVLSVHGRQVKYAYSKDRGGDPGVFFLMIPDQGEISGAYNRSGDSISGTLTNVESKAVIYIATGYKTHEEFAQFMEEQLFSSHVLKLAEGITENDVTAERNGLDLVIRIGEEDSFTVSNWYNGDQLNQLEFADGTVWTAEKLHEMGLTVTSDEAGNLEGLNFENDILIGSESDDVIQGLTGNDQLFGGAGNDILNGNSGDDVLAGGLGDDVLYAGSGNDVIRFTSGDGHDTLNIVSSAFDYGYTSTQDWDGMSWSDGGRDAFDGFGYTSITVNGQTASNISFGKADGVTRTLTVAGQTFETTAAYLHSNLLELTVVSQGGLPFQLTTSGGLGSDGNEVYTEGVLSVHGKQVKYAYSKDRGGDPGVFFLMLPDDGYSTGVYKRNGDHISGTVSGVENKAVIYIATGYRTQEEFARYIEEELFSSQVLQLAEGITESDVTAVRNGLDLVIGFGAEDSLTVANWYGGDQLDRLVFADGTVWETDQLHEMGLTVASFEAGTLAGLENEDDHLIGSQFDDIIQGFSGNDYLTGGAGNDVLYGDSGNDVLSGGLGDDVMYGGTGDNVFRFESGDGHDTIHIVKPEYNFGYTATKDWDGRSWSDGGRDAFDGFGYTSLTVNGQTVSNISFGQADGVARTVIVDGQTFETTATYLHTNLLELSIVSQGAVPFQLKTSGNLGSDGNEVYNEGTVSVNGKEVKYAFSKDRGGDPGVFFLMVPDEGVASGVYTRSGDNLSGTLSNVETKAKIYIATGYKTQEEFSKLIEEQLFSHNVLQFGEGIVESDISIEGLENDLVIYNSVTNDSITVADWYNGAQLDEIQFSNGVSWKVEDVDGNLQISRLQDSSFDSNASRLIEVMASEQDQSSMMQEPVPSTTSQDLLDGMLLVSDQNRL